MSFSEEESKNPHNHPFFPSTGYPKDPFAHTMSLSDLGSEEGSLLPVTKEIREKIIKRAKEKGITISALLEQLLNEDLELDILHSRPQPIEE